MSQEIRNRIAIKVQELRTSKKLKKEELSLLLGFDNSYISKLEKCNINITIDKLSKIAKYFEVDIKELL
ncbi:helix-turn-helix transcriptional regulator [bacterium]|nr:helix-turn-helix transcriptional regulator [bacterium]